MLLFGFVILVIMTKVSGKLIKSTRIGVVLFLLNHPNDAWSCFLVLALADQHCPFKDFISKKAGGDKHFRIIVFFMCRILT